jgi:hypothetical protein
LRRYAPRRRAALHQRRDRRGIGAAPGDAAPGRFGAPVEQQRRFS